VCCRSGAVAPARQHADAVKGDAEPRAPAWKRPRAVLAVAALGWSGDPRGASLPPPLLALARAARAFVVGPQLHGRTMRADRAHRGVGGQRSAEREPVDQVAELWARDGELEMVPYVRHGEGAVRCARVGPVAAGDGQPIVLCYVALYLYDCAVQSSRVLWCRARRRRDEQLALAAAREGRIAHTPCPCASYGPLGRVCRTP
jgi:hypothetical protein